MQNIALPKKIEFKAGPDLHEGIITVEPLFPGYGMTLGNSLRRVLLSSLPGAAVIGAKIKGASHEFMVLPHVKEDVLEILLNLKQLRLKMYTEEEVRLDLKIKGKKTVKASDITKNSLVEIKNPELIIAHVTNEAGSLEIEITVKAGHGYKIAEDIKKDNREIGYIEIDSIFSPVTIVRISVENTRVGKMTDWDKLVLNVKTDGTISAEDAFKEAVKILVDQYSSFLALAGQKEETGTVETKAKLEKTEKVEEIEEAGEDPELKMEKKEKKVKKIKK